MDRKRANSSKDMPDTLLDYALSRLRILYIEAGNGLANLPIKTRRIETKGLMGNKTPVKKRQNDYPVIVDEKMGVFWSHLNLLRCSAMVIDVLTSIPHPRKRDIDEYIWNIFTVELCGLFDFEFDWECVFRQIWPTGLRMRRWNSCLRIVPFLKQEHLDIRADVSCETLTKAQEQMRGNWSSGDFLAAVQSVTDNIKRRRKIKMALN